MSDPRIKRFTVLMGQSFTRTVRRRVARIPFVRCWPPAVALAFPVLLTPLLLAQATASLESRVALYWDALVRRDKAAAIDLVARDNRNAFIERREPQIQSWRLDKIERESDSEAVVTVQVSRAIPGLPGFHETRVVEAWVLEEGQWRARVKGTDPSSALEQFRSGPDTRRTPAPGRLDVVPDTLRIHFLNRTQTGGVRLANGLESPVEIERIEFDASLFKLTRSPGLVHPLSYGVILLRYIGSDISKDLRSQLRIVTRVGDKRRVFEVPVVYNYLSPGARALFGLTPEAAEKLKPGDKLTPVVPKPPPG